MIPMPVICVAAIVGFVVIVAIALDEWRRPKLEHRWSEEFEIGGQEYDIKPGLTMRVLKRRLRVCNTCMITDALRFIHPYCKGPQSHGER